MGAPILNVSLGPGFIGYINSSVINDFENMPVGTCTTLSGEIVQGNAAFGVAYFRQR